MLMLPFTPEILRAFMALADAAPDELSTIAHVISAPPLPFVPEEHRGRLALMINVVYAGDIEAGERVLVPLRELASPIADQIKPMARIATDASAFAYRRRRLMVNVAATYRTHEDTARLIEWVTDSHSALCEGAVGAHVSFLGEEGESRVRDAYPEPTHRRLATIKRRYDPTNLFRLNQNIAPAGFGPRSA
jgi:FAD/FMN-containing dehydrogenase